MSDDFIYGLEDDLVEAMERYELRSPQRRFAASLRPRWLRPARLAALAAAAAILAGLVVAAPTLVPPPNAARPHVLATLTIGGIPADGVAAGGSLWASELEGSVVRVDPVTRRVSGRLELPTAAGPIAADPSSLWVQTTGVKDQDCKGTLLRIDPTSGRIATRRPMPYPIDGPEGPGLLAATGNGGVWVKQGCTWGRRVDRVDPSGVVSGRLALSSVDGLSTAAGSLWVMRHDGTLLHLDAATGRVRQRWPKLAPLADPETRGSKVLAPDGAGVWVLSTGRAAILRVENGRVVSHIDVGGSALPLLVSARDGLWIAEADRLGSDYRLVRFDPTSGQPTAMIRLGIQQPVALIPTGGQLCVLTSNGKVVFIGS
jgi:hypothetical protein